MASLGMRFFVGYFCFGGVCFCFCAFFYPPHPASKQASKEARPAPHPTQQASKQASKEARPAPQQASKQGSQASPPPHPARKPLDAKMRNVLGDVPAPVLNAFFDPVLDAKIRDILGDVFTHGLNISTNSALRASHSHAFSFF